MRVLVTGGTGFLGKAVVRHLREASHSVRLLVRGTSDLGGLEGIETIRGDVTDAASLVAAAEGCGAIVHMAALVKVWVPEPEAYDRVNVGGLRNALAAAKAVNARLVYTSSFMAVGPSGPEPVDESHAHPGPPYRNAYERTKAEADQVAREAASAGQDVVVLYPGVIYGPGDLTEGNIVVRMLLDHVGGKLPGLIGAGDRLWSYTFVEDAARGHLLALEGGKPGGRYLLCGENATHQSLFEVFRGLTGKAPPRLHIPYPVASASGRLLWAWAELTGHPPLLTHEVVGVLREHWAYSSARAERELGYEKTSLEHGLQKTVSWLRESGRV